MQASNLKARATQFRVLLCPLLLGIKFCIRQLSWNNNPQNSVAYNKNIYFLFTLVICWLLCFGCCLALLRSAPQAEGAPGHSSSHIWKTPRACGNLEASSSFSWKIDKSPLLMFIKHVNWTNPNSMEWGGILTQKRGRWISASNTESDSYTKLIRSI